jgi:hypothetical protein
VYIQYSPIGYADARVDISGSFPVEELSKLNAARRQFLLKTIPAKSEAKLLIGETVKSFSVLPLFGFTGDFFDSDDPVIYDFAHTNTTDDERGGKEYYYFGAVRTVYSEHGKAVRLRHLDTRDSAFIPEDYRSEEGKKRKQEWEANHPK